MELTPAQFMTLNRVAQPRSGIELFTTTPSDTSELQAWGELQTLGLVTVTARENDGDLTIWAAEITTAGRNIWRDTAYGKPPTAEVSHDVDHEADGKTICLCGFETESYPTPEAAEAEFVGHQKTADPAATGPLDLLLRFRLTRMRSNLASGWAPSPDEFAAEVEEFLGGGPAGASWLIVSVTATSDRPIV